MSLEDLQADIEAAYGDFDDEFELSIDRETRNELAMLSVALDPDDPEELVRRAVHMLFQSTVDRGTLDFHLRSSYDCTYDEYLSGMSYEEMGGGPPATDDGDRRYQF